MRPKSSSIENPQSVSWVLTPDMLIHEAEVDVVIEAFMPVCVMTPFVAARRRHFDSAIGELAKRQQAVFRDGSEIPSIREMVKIRVVRAFRLDHLHELVERHASPFGP